MNEFYSELENEYIYEYMYKQQLGGAKKWGRGNFNVSSNFKQCFTQRPK